MNNSERNAWCKAEGQGPATGLLKYEAVEVTHTYFAGQLVVGGHTAPHHVVEAEHLTRPHRQRSRRSRRRRRRSRRGGGWSIAPIVALVFGIVVVVVIVTADLVVVVAVVAVLGDAGQVHERAEHGGVGAAAAPRRQAKGEPPALCRSVVKRASGTQRAKVISFPDAQGFNFKYVDWLASSFVRSFVRS